MKKLLTEEEKKLSRIESKKKWNEKNKIYFVEYAKNHRSSINESSNKYRANNPLKNSEWRTSNAETLSIKRISYYKENKINILSKCKEYRTKNKEQG